MSAGAGPELASASDQLARYSSDMKSKCLREEAFLGLEMEVHQAVRNACGCGDIAQGCLGVAAAGNCRDCSLDQLLAAVFAACLAWKWRTAGHCPSCSRLMPGLGTWAKPSARAGSPDRAGVNLIDKSVKIKRRFLMTLKKRQGVEMVRSHPPLSRLCWIIVPSRFRRPGITMPPIMRVSSRPSGRGNGSMSAVQVIFPPSMFEGSTLAART